MKAGPDGFAIAKFDGADEEVHTDIANLLPQIPIMKKPAACKKPAAQVADKDSAEEEPKAEETEEEDAEEPTEEDWESVKARPAAAFKKPAALRKRRACRGRDGGNCGRGFLRVLNRWCVRHLSC